MITESETDNEDESKKYPVQIIVMKPLYNEQSLMPCRHSQITSAVGAPPAWRWMDAKSPENIPSELCGRSSMGHVQMDLHIKNEICFAGNIVYQIQNVSCSSARQR